MNSNNTLNRKTHWSNDDFEHMSWHDVHVHGFRLLEGEHGAGELLLDIDYILQWLRTEGGFQFRVAPATLQFHQITGLSMSLDYATPTAGITPFSIDGIVRESVIYPNGFASFRWQIEINWPNGEIEFQSPGFSQVLTGPELIGPGQALSAEQRAGR